MVVSFFTGGRYQSTPALKERRGWFFRGTGGELGQRFIQPAGHSCPGGVRALLHGKREEDRPEQTCSSSGRTGIAPGTGDICEFPLPI